MMSTLLSRPPLPRPLGRRVSPGNRIRLHDGTAAGPPVIKGGKRPAAGDASAAVPRPATPVVGHSLLPSYRDCQGKLAGVRVLVVDDEPDACRLVKLLLEDCQATVMTARSAADAVALLGEHSFDVLVSDIGMPRENGYDLMKKIRGREPEQGGDIPAIALTAFVRDEDRQRAFRAGFQIHLTKPVDITRLIAAIGDLARPVDDDASDSSESNR